MIDEEQAQEDDFGGAADIVRSMSPQMPGGSDMIDISEKLGYGSIGHIGKHSGSEAFAREYDAYMKGMAAARSQKSISPEAQFYASVGNMAGAVSMQKTKGPSLFTLGEEFDLGSSGRYAIMPAGEMNAIAKDGSLMRIPVSDYAIQAGVKNVPFSGGDQAAESFRNTLTRTKGLMESLDELEQVYDRNVLYIGRLSPTDLSTKAQQLETKVLMDAMAVLTGTRSLGGNTSNVDIEMLQTMVPKAASTFFTNTKGNEKLRLAELRKHVLNHLMSAARFNGVTLKEMNVRSPRGNQPPPGVLSE